MASGLVASLGDIMQLTYEGRLCGQQVMTRYDYRIDAIAGVPEPLGDFWAALSAIVNTAVTGLFPKYRAAMPTNWSEFAQIYQRIYPTRSPAATTTQVAIGALAPSQAPNTCSAIVKYTDFVGRRGRGSWRMPTPDIGAVATNGIFNAPYVALLAAVAGAGITPHTFLVNTSTYTITPVLVHGPNIVPVATALVGFGVKTTTRVQQRRTVGVGS